MARTYCLRTEVGDVWINAVAELDTPEARELLLSLLDPHIVGLPFEASFARQDVLAARIVDLARRDSAIEERILRLCDIQLPAMKR